MCHLFYVILQLCYSINNKFIKKFITIINTINNFTYNIYNVKNVV